MKPAAPSPAAPPSPLAQLNAHIAQASQAAREVEGMGAVGADTWPELRSAQRFRETWERIAAETQVQQAQDRAPQNAGPLNPERLIVHTLARMGECSPHYLRRFLAHTETLMWLEQALNQLKPASTVKGGVAKSGRAVRRKNS